jgi:hypothetical protein
MIEQGAILPTGVIIGSAVIEKVTPPDAAHLVACYRGMGSGSNPSSASVMRDSCYFTAVDLKPSWPDPGMDGPVTT